MQYLFPIFTLCGLRSLACLSFRVHGYDNGERLSPRPRVSFRTKIGDWFLAFLQLFLGLRAISLRKFARTLFETIQPRPGWAPDPLMVGIRSPDGWAGWWLGLHLPPWSFGFDSQTRGTRENGAPPCVKVPGSSRVPFRLLAAIPQNMLRARQQQPESRPRGGKSLGVTDQPQYPRL